MTITQNSKSSKGVPQVLGLLGKFRHLALGLPKKMQNSGQLNVISKREIMAKCVHEHVGDLYPNPADIPYMGDKWRENWFVNAGIDFAV